ncbi:hypothetical protein Tco_0597423 [Tanacetum coccineum]
MSTAEAECVLPYLAIWYNIQVQNTLTSVITLSKSMLKKVPLNFTMSGLGTEYQLADLFTKALPRERFEYLVHRIVFHMAQQIIPAAQLVPKFQGIERFSKEPDTKDTIIFKLDTHDIMYTVDMFRVTLQLPMETPNNLFVVPATIKIIQSFMQRVGYQGVVDKVSAFYTKFLAQPWQTMFKVFNRCLTTRTYGHDQTKINILQLFHVVVNRTNVDYASLLWWDFMNCVSQKKNVIQYPHFTKLVIADLMKKFTSIPLRFEEDYHSIKDEIPLVSVYITRIVTVRGMLIPDTFLTEEIRATNDYKEYEMVFVNVVLPMNQPQPKQVVKGEKDVESYANKFATSMIHDDVDDSGDRIELGSHKEHLEVVDDDDDDNKEGKKDEKEGDEMGSLKIRTEKMHTPIPTPTRSPRINLSSDNSIAQELTNTVSLSTPTTSKDPLKKKRISSKNNHLPSVLRRMCRRQGYMIRDMERKCVTTSEFWKVHGKVDQVLYEIIPQLAERATYDLIESNLKPIIADTIIQDCDAFRSEVPALISKEFDSHAPQIIEELFKNYVQNNVIQVHPTTTTSTETTSSADLQQQLYLKMKSNPQDQANDPTLWDVLKRKFKKSSTSNTSCRDDEFHSQQHDDHQEDDAPPEGEERVKRHMTSKSLKSVRGSSSKRSAKDSTTYVFKKQQEWDAWEEETFIDEDENGNTEEKKYILSLHKIHAERFLEADLEEKTNRWVHKEFKNFNEDARLSIQHWKDSWHKRVYKQNQRKARDNPDNYFSNHRITEVLAIESYQIKVNLTTPTLTFPGIEAHEPYSIVDKPTTGLIYLNSKDEKRVMYLVEIMKFCDATLEKVLKEVKHNIFKSGPWKKPPMLGELDRDIIRAFEREITKRLRHQEKMRRWESFVNGRPIMPTIKRL